MKKLGLLFLLVFITATLQSQPYMNIYIKGGAIKSMELSVVDSMNFVNSYLRVFCNTGTSTLRYNYNNIDSLTFSQEIPTVPKKTFYTQNAWNVGTNNYQLESSQFCVQRMKETDNFAAFWESGFGDNPETCTTSKYRFNLTDLLNEGEKMYAFYRDKLKFVEKGNSLTDDYRMNLYIYYSDEGTVYGGGSDNKIGVMWMTPNRVNTKPYGAMAHELGHSFQYMSAADGNYAFGSGGCIFEMTSQFMLWQYYPTWITFEKYHLDSFMDATYKAFMHADNQYHSPFVLEYWANKHGIDFIGRLWRESKSGEDPVMAYKRITGITQSEFNDEMLDAYRRFITWDMDRIRTVSKAYINQHKSTLVAAGDGWYKIAASNCPQNYGYNGIRLKVPAAGTEVTLNFQGLAGAEGYNAVNVNMAGWRYGFVAYQKNGTRVYGDTFSASEGEAKFTVPANTSYLWLVVVGAPTSHWKHNANNLEQWPYQIKLTGTSLQ